jgi:hypothetical protein
MLALCSRCSPPIVRKADLTPLDLWLVNVVCRELNAAGFPDDVLGDVAGPVVVVKTGSRQILGFINEMARFAEHAIEDAGGLARCDVGELNREQRQMLQNRDRRHAAPLELVSQRRRRGWAMQIFQITT